MICKYCSNKTPDCTPVLFKGQLSCTKFNEKNLTDWVKIYCCEECSSEIEHKCVAHGNKELDYKMQIPKWCPKRENK